MMTEKLVVSPQVVVIYNVSVSSVPDKKLNSEKPTILKSEYKKESKRTTVPIPPRIILHILVRDSCIKNQ